MTGATDDDDRTGRNRGFNMAVVDSGEPNATTQDDVRRRVLDDPGEFLLAAREQAPGWSEPYGGPTGVLELATAILEAMAEVRTECAELRAAAVAELRQPGAGGPRHTLAAIGDPLGITPQAVRKLHLRGRDQNRRTW